MASQKIPLWLDCDPGHDDAFAILLSLYEPFQLLGISTVHGNAPLTHTTINTLRLLSAYGFADSIPVYAGADRPIVRPALFAPGIHGESGIDGTSLLPVATVKEREGDAIEAMYLALTTQGKVTKNADGTYSGGAWLVTTGTLTNAYALLTRFPDVVESLRGVSVMGGAFGNPAGNIRPNAEFNILADPEAARFVIRHPELQGRMYLTPLDLTHTVLATQEVRDTLLNGATGGLRRMLFELLVFFQSTYESVFGLCEGPPLHDPLAVAVLLKEVDPSLWGPGEWVDVDVLVEGEDFGRTVVTGRPGGVWVPDSVDTVKFWARIMDCVKESEGKYPVQA